MFVAIASNVLKKLTFISMMVLMFISTLSFTTNIRKIEEQNESLTEIADYVKAFQSELKVDSVRTAALKKITRIMCQYNQDLSANEKHSIANEIYNMSVKYDNLDVDLICATITHESARTWQPDVTSPAGAMGLMQVMPHTASFLSKHEGIEWTSPETVLYNPIYNIRMGCRYLSMLIELYNVDGGLAAYNGGERRAAQWLASGRNDEVLFEETRGYIPAVLKLYDTFKD
ncbi:MAG: lytic transglycosylase domain-containing protein [bacterium]